MRSGRLGLAVLAALVAASCVLTTGCGSSEVSSKAGGPVRLQGSALPAHGPEADFALHDQDGRPMRLVDERGRYVLLTFLYTHCHDVCPLTAQRLNAVLHQLGPQRNDVRVLAVSVDPKGDTPVSVRRFVKAHALLPQFLYLTGNRSELEQTWIRYNVAVIPRANDQFRHEAYTTLIDPRGDGRAVYKPPVSTAAVLHDLRALLASTKT